MSLMSNVVDRKGGSSRKLCTSCTSSFLLFCFKDHPYITSAYIWTWPTYPLYQHKYSTDSQRKWPFFNPTHPVLLLTYNIHRDCSLAGMTKNSRSNQNYLSCSSHVLSNSESTNSIVFNKICSCYDLRIQNTVFPHIVSAETIAFWIWKSKGHST